MKSFAVTMFCLQIIAGMSHLYDFTTKKFPMYRKPLSATDIKVILAIQWGIIFWGLWVL